MQNPQLHDIVNMCLEFQSSIHIHYKVTGLQSLEKLYHTAYAIFVRKRALPCVTKIILTEKLLEKEAQIFDLFIWIIGQPTKKIEQDPKTMCV